jgi:hypothetical protein
MSSSTVHCYVLGGDVGVVSDLNGKVTNVICPHFLRLNHSCALKIQETDGVLGGVLASLSDRLTGTKVMFCEFADPRKVEWGK